MFSDEQEQQYVVNNGICIAALVQYKPLKGLTEVSDCFIKSLIQEQWFGLTANRGLFNPLMPEFYFQGKPRLVLLLRTSSE